MIGTSGHLHEERERTSVQIEPPSDELDYPEHVAPSRSFGYSHTLGTARPGEAWHGTARPGKAGLGMGDTLGLALLHKVKAGRGTARHGTAWYGTARYGMAWHGYLGETPSDYTWSEGVSFVGLVWDLLEPSSSC